MTASHQPSASVAVIFHSGQGHTATLAHAVLKGVEAAGGNGALFDADSAILRLSELEQFDGLVFGSPTYMGSVSANFKLFMEESRLARGQWRDKVAAGFTNSASQSGDKLNTLVQLAIFAAQHGMLWVSLGLKAGNNSTQGSVDDLNRLGSFLGAMAQSNVDENAEFAPPQSDRDTAFNLGQRVAQIAQQLRIGKHMLETRVCMSV
jgi:NAD(P)H dehydrogenase (quinone)